MDTGQGRKGLVERLRHIVDTAPDDGLTLGQIRAELADSAFGGMLAVLALPCCLPFVYVLPQIVALPMALIAAQMALGRDSLWLPDALAARTMRKQDLQSVLRRLAPPLAWLDIVARARLRSVTGNRRAIGVLLFLFALCILVPIPGTNTVPGIAVLIASLGLLERDGLMIVAGVVIGLAWIAFLVGTATLGGIWIVELLRT